MSGELIERLKASRPDVDWDTELARARERRDREGRRWTVRIRHWVHARLHPDLHARACETCQK